MPSLFFFVFFFNDPATTEIYTLSLHDALPICSSPDRPTRERRRRCCPHSARRGRSTGPFVFFSHRATPNVSTPSRSCAAGGGGGGGGKTRARRGGERGPLPSFSPLPSGDG